MNNFLLVCWILLFLFSFALSANVALLAPLWTPRSPQSSQPFSNSIFQMVVFLLHFNSIWSNFIPQPPTHPSQQEDSFIPHQFHYVLQHCFAATWRDEARGMGLEYGLGMGDAQQILGAWHGSSTTYIYFYIFNTFGKTNTSYFHISLFLWMKQKQMEGLCEWGYKEHVKWKIMVWGKWEKPK